MKNLTLKFKKSSKVLIYTFLFLIPIVFFNVTSLNAQDINQADQQVQISDVEGLRTEFKQYTQSPSTKTIKFEMILKSNIDSDRVRIVWTTSGPNFIPEQEGYVVNLTSARKDIVIEKGKSYVIPIEITVLNTGVNEIFGRAEAFTAESAYIATVRKNYGSNPDGEVLPLTDEYNRAKTLNTILNIVVIILIIVVILAIGFILLKKFLSWLDKEDRDI